jgi:hypothetical protein
MPSHVGDMADYLAALHRDKRKKIQQHSYNLVNTYWFTAKRVGGHRTTPSKKNSVLTRIKQQP